MEPWPYADGLSRSAPERRFIMTRLLISTALPGFWPWAPPPWPSPTIIVQARTRRRRCAARSRPACGAGPCCRKRRGRPAASTDTGHMRPWRARMQAPAGRRRAAAPRQRDARRLTMRSAAPNNNGMRGPGNAMRRQPRASAATFQLLSPQFQRAAPFSRGRRPIAGRTGWYAQRWTYGQILPSLFWAQDYWLNDYNDFGLVPPPPGTVWVRDGNDALLIDQQSGRNHPGGIQRFLLSSCGILALIPRPIHAIDGHRARALLRGAPELIRVRNKT